MPGDNLDLTSDAGSTQGQSPQPGGRRFVGIHFTCCDVYTRIYLRPDGVAYVGHCPRCSRPVTIKVGPGGTESRFFTAG